jgi:hypothetical protein
MHQSFIQVGNTIINVSTIIGIYHLGNRVEVRAVGLREAMVIRGEAAHTLWQWAQSPINTHCLVPLSIAAHGENGK